MEKIKNIQKTLRNEKSCILFFSKNVFMLTGFKSSNAFLIITKNNVLLTTDFRYIKSCEKALENKIKIEELKKGYSMIDILKKNKVSEIKTTLKDLDAILYLKFSKEFEVKNINKEVENILITKNNEDLEKIEKLVKLSDEAFKKSLPYLKENITEKEFSWILEKNGRELGLEKTSFDAIIAFSENSSFPHHSVTNKKLKKNTPILIDFGFMLNGFCSDCTRSMFFGKPTEKWISYYKKIINIQDQILAKIKVENLVYEIAEFGDKEIGIDIPHAFGHGIGFEVHENPIISKLSKEKFINNTVVTSEPSVYFENEFGIRIEDMIFVNKNGNKFLTSLDKTLENAIINCD